MHASICGVNGSTKIEATRALVVVHLAGFKWLARAHGSVVQPPAAARARHHARRLHLNLHAPEGGHSNSLPEQRQPHVGNDISLTQHTLPASSGQSPATLDPSSRTHRITPPP